MRSIFISLFLLVSIVLTGYAEGFIVDYSQQDDKSHVLTFALQDYDITSINIDGENYTKILYDGSVVTKKAGFAELPFIHASVMLDATKNVDLQIIPIAYEEIKLENPCLPSKGVLYRCGDDPDDIPYQIDPKSITDKFYPENLADMTDPYILRDIRGTNVYVYPFQYNAAQQVLRIYTMVQLVLVEDDSSPINPLDKANNKIVRDMDPIYNSVFINYSNNRDDLTIGESGDILVITTARDEVAIQPYVDWKWEKGFNISVELVATGTNINTLVDDAYANNNDLLYVQLVGDWDDIKCDVSGSAPMDPQVGCVVGSDDYADLIVGRISSNSPDDVTTQVDKFINYEKFPLAAGTWYSAATGIASNEGPGDDGEDDWEHTDVIWFDKLDPFTYDTYSSIYDPGASAADVSTAVEAGTSIINYTGHGYNQGWGTTGFSNSDVANLSNGDMLPIIVSVACNNGDFHTGTCFGEAWLRHDDGGAVIMMAASISQPWDPPMRGQDYFMDLLIGGYDYDAHPDQSGISTTEQRSTFGSAVFNGLTLMCTESGGSSDWETAKTWNLFGDPSLQARTAAPEELTLSNDVISAGVPFTTTVTTANGAFEGALVALSQDDEMISAYTDASGTVTLNHTFDPGAATLVVTGFNTETIYEEITVVPPGGAYIMFEDVTVNDINGNGNGLLDYAEISYLTVSLTNVGTEDATNVDAVLSTTDPYVIIIDDNESYGTIEAGATVGIENGFEIEISEEVPDGHQMILTITASTITDETWPSIFTLQAHAPVMDMMSYYIDDVAGGNGDGRLDAGETADIVITVGNNGSSEAFNVVGGLMTYSEYVTLNTSTANYGNIIGGEGFEQSFNITTSTTTPDGHLADFSMDITADHNINGTVDFNEVIGRIPVLIVDLDQNSEPPSVMAGCLANLGVSFETMDDFPENLDLYSSVFVCLGVYPQNTTLENDQGQLLADYLNNGGNVYMEGGDTWAYDDPTPVHPLFNIDGVSDGSDDLSILSGLEGSIVDGLNYGYGGDNSYIDHLAPLDVAVSMFNNQAPEYTAAISFENETYKTIGSSFEFAGLVEADASVDSYMQAILEFFGFDIVTALPEIEESELYISAYPNPFKNSTSIAFNLSETMNVKLDIYNLTGQGIVNLIDTELGSGIHEVIWNGTDASGNYLPDGIYFYTLKAGTKQMTRKLILMK